MKKQLAAALDNLTGEAKFDGPIKNALAEYRVQVARNRKPKEAINIDASVGNLASLFVEPSRLRLSASQAA